VIKLLVFITVFFSLLALSDCGGENVGSVVKTQPAPSPGTAYPPPPSPGVLPPFPPVVAVPAAPSPGPVPFTPPVVADDPAHAPTFAKISQSIFKVSCVGCHSSANPSGRIAGDLDLSTYAGTLTKVTPGDPEHSVLYQYVDNGVMPPTGALPPDQMLELHDWIAAGAKNN